MNHQSARGGGSPQDVGCSGFKEAGVRAKQARLVTLDRAGSARTRRPWEGVCMQH